MTSSSLDLHSGALAVSRRRPDQDWRSTGDVIDVSYLDTTYGNSAVAICSRPIIDGAHIGFLIPRSGLNVYNYTCRCFLTSERNQISVAYESDLEFIAETMQSASRPKKSRAHDEPSAWSFAKFWRRPSRSIGGARNIPRCCSTNANTGSMRSCVTSCIPRKPAAQRPVIRSYSGLNAAPERVMFPNSNAR